MRKGVYNPKAVLLHAASLRQGCPHCARFLIAAPRRSLGRVSVPVRLTILSDQLPVVAMVGRYPTIELIGRRPLPQPGCPAFLPKTGVRGGASGISTPFEMLSRSVGQVAYVVRDRSPLGIAPPLDLHFLGTPQAFVLSQDQTLHQS